MNKQSTKFLTALCFLMLLITPLLAQTPKRIVVQGTVTSAEDGEPLIGATVQIASNTKSGVITDFDGRYKIRVRKGAKLIVSYVGMKSKTVLVKGQRLDIKLKSDAKLLDEVVAIGYATVKKKELTGAATQVKAESLENVVSTDVGMALQGLVSGVSVTSSAGDPGSVANIQIRGVTSISGSNTPLFVVDGIPQQENPNLSSNEIQTIDILKDAASCAIYGTRGAAGVILITTKQGEKGRVKFAFDATYGVQEIAYDRLPDLMNTTDQTYVDILKGRKDGYADMQINYMLSKNSYYYMNNTDVMDVLLKEGNSPEQSYNLNMSGGSNNITYNVILGYYNQEGVVLNSGFDRYNLRNNLTYKKDKLKVSVNTSFTMQKIERATGSSLSQALRYMPYTPEIDRDATSFEVPGTGYSTEVAAVSTLLRSFQTTNETLKNTYTANLGVDYKITKDLSFMTKLGANLTNIYNEKFVPSASVYDSEGTEVSKGNANSYVSNESTRSFAYNWHGGLNYWHTFHKNHKLGASAIVSYEEYDFRGFNGGRYGVSDNSITVINGGTERPFANSKTFYTDRLLGFIGRVQYNYKSRYLFSTSLRADASSKFAKDNRWGYFPSASAGWNVSDEAFWSPIKEVANNFKLRASIGTTGNQSFPSYSYMSTLETGFDYADASGSTVFGSTQTTYPTPDVKWETSVQTNIGFDLGFLDNRITLSGDVYRTDKKDMLATVKLPASTGVGTTGYSLVTKNIGNMVNEGFELNLTGKQHFGKLFVSAGLNYSKNTNEITSLGDGNELIYNSNSMIINGDGNSVTTVFAKGYEAGAFFLYKTDGVANTQEKLEAFQKLKADAKMGDLIFVDSNKDGKIGNDDRTYCGSGLPDFEMGFNLSLKYKQFDFSTQWFASYGNEIINGAEAQSFDSGRNQALVSQWSTANTSSNIPVYRGTGKVHMNYIGYSDLWVEDGSFIRMKAATLGYTLPKHITSVLGLTKARFFVTGQNLLTFTKYSGMDPEIGGNGLSTRGLDKGGYPISKKIMFGVKTNF